VFEWAAVAWTVVPRDSFSGLNGKNGSLRPSRPPKEMLFATAFLDFGCFQKANVSLLEAPEAKCREDPRGDRDWFVESFSCGEEPEI
jgi:hypothetical protein